VDIGKSCENEVDVMNRAKKTLKDEFNGRPFTQEGLWEIMQNYPKWDAPVSVLAVRVEGRNTKLSSVEPRQRPPRARLKLKLYHGVVLKDLNKGNLRTIGLIESLMLTGMEFHGLLDTDRISFMFNNETYSDVNGQVIVAKDVKTKGTSIFIEKRTNLVLLLTQFTQKNEYVHFVLPPNKELREGGIRASIGKRRTRKDFIFKKSNHQDCGE
nr:hypothetical protein [Tanacetum cinerariifolium]